MLTKNQSARRAAATAVFVAIVAVVTTAFWLGERREQQDTASSVVLVDGAAAWTKKNETTVAESSVSFLPEIAERILASQDDKQQNTDEAADGGTPPRPHYVGNTDAVWMTAMRQRYEALKSNHPYCFRNSVLNTTTSGHWALDLRTNAAYIRSDIAPPYDHISCFIMRRNFNCAVPPRPPDTNVDALPPSQTLATDWRMVLQKESAQDCPAAPPGASPACERCDLHQFITDMGGPSGIAQYLNASLKQPKQTLNFILQGNSHLRQVWESMVCTYESQMTDLTVQMGGPVISLAALEARNGTLWSTAEQTGRMRKKLENKPDGCHGNEPWSVIRQYYREDVANPPHLNGCHDDIAMVEFDHRIRFYHFFHPERYQSPVEIYEKIGLQVEDIDGIIANNRIFLLPGNFEDFALAGETDRRRKLEDDAEIKPRRHRPITTLLLPDITTFREIQERDVGYWHGANNPAMQVVPDIHACSPGVPEDEVNILLFALMRGIGITF